MSQPYDIIGDIHGRADALEELLTEIGYRQINGIYEHPEGRKVVFLGDFIDKGPQQKRAVEIVRNMVESGNALAVMGNHEFNAICYATQMEDGHYIRPHNDKNAHQHGKFLDEFTFGSDEYHETIEWFKTLPVYLDLEDFRVVHACWHDDAVGALNPYLNEDNSLSEDVYEAYDRKEQPFYDAIEVIIKGPNIKLPGGASYEDDNGHVRDEGRLFWWASAQTPNSQKISVGKEEMDETLARQLDASEKIRSDFMKSAKPTIIGHYFQHGRARHLSNDVTGLDYRGQVTGYQWNGPHAEGGNRFVEIPSNAY